MDSPLVSVVTATYNRSNIPRLTIESLLRSAFGDWELIVVGDACTDDTEAVVRTFGDPRIQFTNLPYNHGEQSGPNNAGVAMARGRYVAFLNHDDFWTSDHLAVTVDALERGDCDLVFTLELVIGAQGRPAIMGATANGLYDGYTFVPASSWVFRRELPQRIGRWRSARTIFGIPSQDWLFRAMKAGALMRSIPKVTVVAVPSSSRAGSYAERQSAENERIATLLRDDPEFFTRELTRIAAQTAAGENLWRIGWHLRQALMIAARQMAVALGVQPVVLRKALRYHRRGGYVDSLRRTRGLPPLGERPGGPDGQ